MICLSRRDKVLLGRIERDGAPGNPSRRPLDGICDIIGVLGIQVMGAAQICLMWRFVFLWEARPGRGGNRFREGSMCDAVLNHEAGSSQIDFRHWPLLSAAPW